MATFVAEGNRIDYTPSSAVAAGDVIVQGEMVGVATSPIAADELGSLAIEGVIDFAKSTGGSTAISAGAVCYWDASAEVATEDADSGTNKRIGMAIATAGDSAATVRIKLGL